VVAPVIELAVCGVSGDGPQASTSAVVTPLERKEKEAVSIVPTPIVPANSTPHHNVWTKLFGCDEWSFLGNLTPFEEALRTPTRSLTSVQNTIIEVRTAMSREEGALATVTMLVEERKKVMEHILSRLEVKAGLLLVEERDALVCRTSYLVEESEEEVEVTIDEE